MAGHEKRLGQVSWYHLRGCLAEPSLVNLMKELFDMRREVCRPG